MTKTFCDVCGAPAEPSKRYFTADAQSLPNLKGWRAHILTRSEIEVWDGPEPRPAELCARCRVSLLASLARPRAIRRPRASFAAMMAEAHSHDPKPLPATKTPETTQNPSFGRIPPKQGLWRSIWRALIARPLP